MTRLKQDASDPSSLKGDDPVESPPTTNLPFELLEVESTYRVVDSVKHEYVRRDLARLRYDARFYERRFRWTGTTDHLIAPEVLSETDAGRHRLHGPVVRENDDAVFIIDLGQTIAARRKVEIITKHNLLDEHGTFQPYLRHRVSSETANLTLRVILPPESLASAKPFVLSAASMARHDVPKSIRVSEESDLGTYSIEVTRPRVGYVYGIEWL